MNLKSRFNGFQKLNASFSFLVNPFMVDVISEGSPPPKMLLTEISAAELIPGNPG
jgi:hypothetical protein